MINALWRGSTYKKVVISSVILNLVGLIVYGIASLAHGINTSKSGTYNPSTANMFEHNGVMSRSDYAKICSLYTQLSQGKSFSDVDISWLVALTTRPPLSGTLPAASAIRHDAGLELLEADIKMGRATSAEKDKIFNVAVSLLTSKEETGIDVMSATNVLRTLNDKRAIPFLVPLLNSPNPNVRDTVGNSLKAMGYSPGT